MKNKENLNEFFIPTLLGSAFLIGIIRVFMIIFDYFIFPRFEDGILDKNLTDKMIKLTKNKKVKVFMVIERYPNAYSNGTTCLFYSSGLRKLLIESELIAVLCHEYGHYREKHLYKEGMFVVTGTSFSLVCIFLIFNSFLLTNILTVIHGVVSVIGSRFSEEIARQFYINFFSKKEEFIADSYAVKLGYKKEFISVLKKLEIDFKKEVCKKMNKQECDLFIENIHKGGTHPSFKARIEKILNQLIPVISFGNKGVKYGIMILDKLQDKLIKSKEKSE